MNANEPVAIVKKMTISGIDNFPIERFTELKEGVLLYTHPAKTLTDEEIQEIWKEFDDKDADNWFIKIARAILRKAQEK